MVSVQDENLVHGTGQGRAGLVLLSRDRETHAQEILAIRQLIDRIDELLALGIFIDPCCEGRHFRDQTDVSEVALFRVRAVHGARIEGRHRADGSGQHGHWVAVTAKSVKETVHLSVEQSVLGDETVKLTEFGLRRQFAIQQQVSNFEKAGLLRQLINRIAAMQKNAFFAIDERDLALARAGRRKPRVQRKNACFGIQAFYIYDIGTVCSAHNRKLNRLVFDVQRRCTCLFRLIDHLCPYLCFPFACC